MDEGNGDDNGETRLTVLESAVWRMTNCTRRSAD